MGTRTIRDNRTGPIDFNTELSSRYEACQLTVNNDVHGFATDMYQSDRPVTGVLAFILINPLIDSKHCQNCVNGDLSLTINELHKKCVCYFDIETRNSYATLCGHHIVLSDTFYWYSDMQRRQLKEIHFISYHDWIMINFFECTNARK